MQKRRQMTASTTPKEPKTVWTLLWLISTAQQKEKFYWKLPRSLRVVLWVLELNIKALKQSEQVFFSTASLFVAPYWWATIWTLSNFDDDGSENMT